MMAWLWPGAQSLLDAHIRAVTIEVMVHFCLLHVRRPMTAVKLHAAVPTSFPHAAHPDRV